MQDAKEEGMDGILKIHGCAGWRAVLALSPLKSRCDCMHIFPFKKQ